MSERQLIERVLEGDPGAERELYDAHVDRVYRLAYRMTGDDDTAQDVAQETFIRAFDRLAEFRGESALSTWLHSIAVSSALNALRKVKRQETRHVPIDEVVLAGDRGVAVEPDLKRRLHAAIDALPEAYRTVVVMHDVEGYTHEEIGGALDVAPGTSKARLSRARSKLRAELSDFAEWVS